MGEITDAATYRYGSKGICRQRFDQGIVRIVAGWSSADVQHDQFIHATGRVYLRCLERMADSSQGVTYAQLAWTQAWYLSEETYAAALACIVDAQAALPLAQVWGDGTTSSSDGQFFRSGRRGAAGAINAKYGADPGQKIYTHVSDQYAPFHSQLISATAAEAPHVLDGLLHNASSLDIHEHYTDTGGATDHVFTLCHLLGYRFVPRIRDLADRRLGTFEAAGRYHWFDGDGMVQRFAIGSRYTVRGFDGELLLTGDRGWLLRQELAIAIADSDAEAFSGLDAGEVGGPASAVMRGTRLAGAVIGLRGSSKHLYWEAFVGTPLTKPETYRTSKITSGFNLNLSF